MSATLLVFLVLFPRQSATVDTNLASWLGCAKDNVVLILSVVAFSKTWPLRAGARSGLQAGPGVWEGLLGPLGSGSALLGQCIPAQHILHITELQGAKATISSKRARDAQHILHLSKKNAGGKSYSWLKKKCANVQGICNRSMTAKWQTRWRTQHVLACSEGGARVFRPLPS